VIIAFLPDQDLSANVAAIAALALSLRNSLRFIVVFGARAALARVSCRAQPFADFRQALRRVIPSKAKSLP